LTLTTVEDGPPASRKPLLIMAGIIIALIIIAAVGVVFSSTSETGGDAGPTSVDEMDVVISIHDYKYRPAIISVPRGATVSWFNDDKVDHTATDKGGHWDTQIIHGGESKTLTLNAPGTYTYYCTLHPYMTGEITVRQQAVDATPAASDNPSTPVQ
jgi:plastocyanin